MHVSSFLVLVSQFLLLFFSPFLRYISFLFIQWLSTFKIFSIFVSKIVFFDFQYNFGEQNNSFYSVVMPISNFLTFDLQSHFRTQILFLLSSYKNF